MSQQSLMAKLGQQSPPYTMHYQLEGSMLTL